ncbi:MAG: hypothetical protein QOF77_896 [Solirubrobacteraceae bacterium]|nr:hypothetical protein [Solirubrobacteraceae bacterium]
MRRLRRARLWALVTATAATLAAAAAAVPAGAALAPAGYDVSYPLCGAALPAGAAFGIVGVNGGLANNANPCLAAELAWAAVTPGLPSPAQPPVSLYLNTADPGNRVPDWPTPVNGSAGGATPYGGCDGGWSPACAYLYGLTRAAYGYGVAAAVNAPIAHSVPWWLDVETVSSWARPADLPGWAAVNLAAVAGFVAGLRSAGAGGPIGIYSTRSQWLAITAAPDSHSAAGGVLSTTPEWVAGLGTASQAATRCADSFAGGPVRLVQFAAAGLDGDLACPTPTSARLRIVGHAVRGGALRVSGTISPTYAGRVTVELTASYLGRLIHRSRSPVVSAGRWQAVLALPRHGRLRGGVVVASSPAAIGLLAGSARAQVRL